MSSQKRRNQAVNRRRWAAEAIGVEVVEPPRVERRGGPRLVLVPAPEFGTARYRGPKGLRRSRKVASSPWRQRLWDVRHPQPETEPGA